MQPDDFRFLIVDFGLQGVIVRHWYKYSAVVDTTAVGTKALATLKKIRNWKFTTRN